MYQSHSTLTGSGTDTLQMLSQEEGRIRWAYHKYTNGTSAYQYEYDFFVRDNQGNTRMVLTQQKDTARYLASMEAAYRSTETALFNNITNSSYARNLIAGYPTDGTTTPNDSVSHLNGSGQKTGPSLLLKVMSGDAVDIGVHSFYTSQTGTGTSASITDVLNSLASGISNMTAGAKGTVGQLTNPSGTLYAALNNFITNNDPDPPGKPKAYLNWILFDEQLNPVSSYPQTGAIPVGNYTAGTLGTPGQTGIPMTKNGYLYIWVSNETQGWDVYFDNLSVTHRTGPLLEENHYYPFGLAMAAISAKALKTNYAENKLRYNGGSELQNKEFSDGSGLEMYETPFRGYDAQIGRFGQIDPMAGSYLDYSSYSYCSNNPVLFSDPSGAIIKYQLQNNLLQIDEYDLFEKIMGGGGGGGGSMDVAGQNLNALMAKSQEEMAARIAKSSDSEITSATNSVTLTGSAAESYFAALQAANSNDDGQLVDLLLLGGADLKGTGLSHESLEIINEVSKNANIFISTINPDYTNDDPDNLVHGAAESLYDAYQQGYRIFIYGYSLGGNYALQISRELNTTNTPVDLLITVDAAFGPFSVDRTVTPNVETNYNFYQTTPSFPLTSHGGPNTANDPSSTTIYNINATNKSFYDIYSQKNETINHQNMDQYSLFKVIDLIGYYYTNKKK